MKNKRNLITVITIFIVITVIIIIFIFSNKRNLFNKFIIKSSDIIINKLDYKTITGNTKLNIKMDCITNGNKIISSMNYKGNYQINLKKGFINITGESTYNKEKLDSNIYIQDNKIYILSDDVYNKYVAFDTKYLDFLNYNEEYKYIIKTLTKELNKILNKNYYTYSTDEFNNQKVNKTQLNLKEKKYTKLKKELVKNLINDNKFIESISKYKNITKKESKKYIEDYDFKNYKFSLYTNKTNNNFVGFEFSNEEIDFNIKYKNNKYSFEYYVRDGLIYSCYIKLKNNNISKFNLQDIINQWNLDIKIEENNIKYNEKIKKINNIDSNKVVKYNELTNKDKDKMKKNSTINKIYNNYTNRFIPNLVSGGSLYTDIDEIKTPILD